MGRLLAIGLAAMTMSAKAMGCDAALPDHVRILDCRLAAAVANAAGRSAILRDILERVERTDGLVYITQPPVVGPATRLLGGLSHNVTVAGRFRVLRIFVSGKLDDSAMAIVGHELRHALEVLELSTACTEAEVDALFDRLGWRTAGHAVETQAALDAGYAVERELKAAKAQGGSSNDDLAA
jgi:hypothetical protein